MVYCLSFYPEEGDVSLRNVLFSGIHDVTPGKTVVAFHCLIIDRNSIRELLGRLCTDRRLDPVAAEASVCGVNVERRSSPALAQ